MDAIAPAVITVVALLGLVVYHVLARRYGVDPRPTSGADYARPLGTR
jgi:hypothetical protein